MNTLRSSLPYEVGTPTIDGPSDLAGAEADAKYIFGDDERTPVRDTSTPGFRNIVLVVSTFPTKNARGNVASCTGTLIGPDTVLTAAHCVYDPSRGGRVTRVKVTPGALPDKLGKQRALSYGSVTSTYVYYRNEFTRSATYDHTIEPFDYAVVRLDSPLGDHTGYRQVSVATRPADSLVRSIAYRPYTCSSAVPACRSAKALEMYEIAGRVGPVRAPGLFDSYIDGVGGSSGAPILGTGLDRDRVIGADIAQWEDPTDYNSSLLITASVLADIQRWSQVLYR